MPSHHPQPRLPPHPHSLLTPTPYSRPLSTHPRSLLTPAPSSPPLPLSLITHLTAGERGGRGQGAGRSFGSPHVSTPVSPASGPSSAGVTAAPAGVWAPTAGRWLAAGSPGGPWRVSVQGGGRVSHGRGGPGQGHTHLGKLWAWHVTRPVSLWAAGAPGVRPTVLHARPVSRRAPVQSCGTIKALGEQVGAESLPPVPGLCLGLSPAVSRHSRL